MGGEGVLPRWVTRQLRADLAGMRRVVALMLFLRAAVRCAGAGWSNRSPCFRPRAPTPKRWAARLAARLTRLRGPLLALCPPEPVVSAPARAAYADSA